MEKVAADYKETYSRSESCGKRLTTACQLKCLFFVWLTDWSTDCLTSYLPIRSFIFGFMEGSDYIQGLVMGWVYSHILLMLHRCQPAAVKSVTPHFLWLQWGHPSIPHCCGSLHWCLLPAAECHQKGERLTWFPGWNYGWQHPGESWFTWAALGVVDQDQPVFLCCVSVSGWKQHSSAHPSYNLWREIYGVGM